MYIANISINNNVTPPPHETTARTKPGVGRNAAPKAGGRGKGCAKTFKYHRVGSCDDLLESAGDGGFMVIGLSGSLGDGDGSRLVSMVATAPVPFVCKCCKGCNAAGGGGERRPLTPGIKGPPP